MKRSLKAILPSILVALGLSFGGGSALAMDAGAPVAAASAAEAPAAAPMPAEPAPPAESGSESLEVDASEAQPEPGEAAEDAKGTAELGADLYSAIKAGQWIAAIGLALLLLVSLARKFGGKWAKTRIGGYALGFGVPMLATLGLSMSTGKWSIEAFAGAFSIGLTASGLQRGAKHAKRAKDARAAK